MDLMDFFAFLSAMEQNADDSINYDEIKKLDKMLTEADIPHYFQKCMGGFQVTYFGAKGKPKPEPGCYYGSGYGAICSAVQSSVSYGSHENKIEISGLLTDEEAEKNSVAGYLTAEDVFERIKNHWMNEKKA